MRPPAFLAGEGALMDDARDGKQVAGAWIFRQFTQKPETRSESRGISNNARMAPCDFSNLFPSLKRRGGAKRRGGQFGRGLLTRHWSLIFAHRDRGPASKDQPLEQGIACQPIRSVHPTGCNLTGCIQAAKTAPSAEIGYIQ